MSEEYYETSQRMPTEADAMQWRVLAWDAATKCWLSPIISIIRSDPLQWPYWRKLPPAPKTPCERAFEEAKAFLAAGNMSAKDIFQAGWEAAKKEQP